MAVEGLTPGKQTVKPKAALTTPLTLPGGTGSLPGATLTGDTASATTGGTGAQATLGLDAAAPAGTPGGLSSSDPPRAGEVLREYGFVDANLKTPDRPEELVPSYPPVSAPPAPEPKPEPKPVPPPKKPEDCPPEPKANGLTFKSWGDPHEITGDGLKFDNQLVGDFVAMLSKSGDFELQKRHENVGGQNNGVTFNTEASLKTDGDVVHFDSQNNTLSINGQPANLGNGQTVKLPGGGTVTRNGNNYTINTAKGDTVTFIDQGQYMDIEGKLSDKRADGEVIGSLGRFDADTDASNDLVMPDGTLAKDVDSFLQAWRVGAPGTGSSGKLIPGYASGDPSGPTAASVKANRIMLDAMSQMQADDEKRRQRALEALQRADHKAAAAKTPPSTGKPAAGENGTPGAATPGTGAPDPTTPTGPAPQVRFASRPISTGVGG
jgi:hypothetical protein